MTPPLPAETVEIEEAMTKTEERRINERLGILERSALGIIWEMVRVLGWEMAADGSSNGEQEEEKVMALLLNK